MTQTPRYILLVEDDPRLGRLICSYLRKQGFRTELEPRGDKAALRIPAEQPDLVVLDLLLPGMDGLKVCQQVRNDYQGPILMLTALEDDMDQVAGLEMGADDYVKKPIEPRVLLARIRALMRRTEPAGGAVEAGVPEPEMLSFGGLELRRTSLQVTLNGLSLDLTTNEFDLLWLLASHPGRIMNRSELYFQLRGMEYDGLDRSVDLIISHLRRKLEKDPAHPTRIRTIWRKGYLFAADAW